MIFKDFDKILKFDVLLLSDDTFVRAAVDKDDSILDNYIEIVNDFNNPVSPYIIVLNLGNVDITENLLNETKLKYPEYFI